MLFPSLVCFACHMIMTNGFFHLKQTKLVTTSDSDLAVLRTGVGDSKCAASKVDVERPARTMPESRSAKPKWLKLCMKNGNPIFAGSSAGIIRPQHTKDWTDGGNSTRPKSSTGSGRPKQPQPNNEKDKPKFWKLLRLIDKDT